MFVCEAQSGASTIDAEFFGWDARWSKGHILKCLRISSSFSCLVVDFGSVDHRFRPDLDTALVLTIRKYGRLSLWVANSERSGLDKTTRKRGTYLQTRRYVRVPLNLCCSARGIDALLLSRGKSNPPSAGCLAINSARSNGRLKNRGSQASTCVTLLT